MKRGGNKTLDKIKEIVAEMRQKLHDVNNCLASIRTQAEVLCLDSTSQEDTTDCAKDIVEATRQAFDLTRHLMSETRKMEQILSK